MKEALDVRQIVRRELHLNSAARRTPTPSDMNVDAAVLAGVAGESPALN